MSHKKDARLIWINVKKSTAAKYKQDFICHENTAKIFVKLC